MEISLLPSPLTFCPFLSVDCKLITANLNSFPYLSPRTLDSLNPFFFIFSPRPLGPFLFNLSL
jgi:hypothetical protein